MNGHGVLKIFITKPIIINFPVRTEGKRAYGQLIFYISRKAEIVPKRLHLSICSRHLRYFIFCALIAGKRVFTVELFPVLPKQAIWNEKKESIHISIIHGRNNRRSHAAKERCFTIKSITGIDLIDIKRNKSTCIQRGLYCMRTLKR